MNDDCKINDRPKNFKKLIQSKVFKKTFLGVLIGGILGFLYYYFVGCSSGTCAITSSPYGSIIMGGIFGLLITNSPCSQNNCRV